MATPAIIGNLGWPELLIIGVILVLLFGAAKLPELARSSGQALRIFKKEIKEDGHSHNEDEHKHIAGK